MVPRAAASTTRLLELWPSPASAQMPGRRGDPGAPCGPVSQRLCGADSAVSMARSRPSRPAADGVGALVRGSPDDWGDDEGDVVLSRHAEPRRHAPSPFHVQCEGTEPAGAFTATADHRTQVPVPDLTLRSQALSARVLQACASRRRLTPDSARSASPSAQGRSTRHRARERGTAMRSGPERELRVEVGSTPQRESCARVTATASQPSAQSERKSGTAMKSLRLDPPASARRAQQGCPQSTVSEPPVLAAEGKQPATNDPGTDNAESPGPNAWRVLHAVELLLPHAVRKWLAQGGSRDVCYAQWFVDGAATFDAMYEALRVARRTIMIAGWWVYPYTYLKRPPCRYPETRLDRVLLDRAQHGVEVSGGLQAQHGGADSPLSS